MHSGYIFLYFFLCFFFLFLKKNVFRKNAQMLQLPAQLLQLLTFQFRPFKVYTILYTLLYMYNHHLLHHLVYTILYSILYNILYVHVQYVVQDADCVHKMMYLYIVHGVYIAHTMYMYIILCTQSGTPYCT